MVRRSLVAELDPQVERPELRQFDASPVATVEADRGRYVSACLIIVRAYIAAGRPGLLQPLASFNEWSDLVRSALVWLGCADPVLSMEAARDNDPELSELREVMAAWKQAFGSVPPRAAKPSMPLWSAPFLLTRMAMSRPMGTRSLGIRISTTL